jgi:(p)ppGpp synthase/HD superfamily hydrolase
MKKYLIPFILATTLTGFAEEEKPKVTLRETTETQNLENPAIQNLQETRKKLADLAHNDAVVMKNFDNLAEILTTAYQKEKSMTALELQEICSGIDFASEKHRFQTRKNKEKTPYISHPIGVAYHLMNTGEVRDAGVIIGALLHDTVEDTQTTFEELEKKFGTQIAGYVRELTDDKTLSQEARKRGQVINASHKTKGAAQIKLADKLFNLHDLFNNPPPDWSEARIDRYYEWAQSVIDRLPAANEKLHDAVLEIINEYWEKQAVKKP